jgi:hypothetical protein
MRRYPTGGDRRPPKTAGPITIRRAARRRNGSGQRKRRAMSRPSTPTQASPEPFARRQVTFSALRWVTWLLGAAMWGWRRICRSGGGGGARRVVLVESTRAGIGESTVCRSYFDYLSTSRVEVSAWRGRVERDLSPHTVCTRELRLNPASLLRTYIQWSRSSSYARVYIPRLVSLSLDRRSDELCMTLIFRLICVCMYSHPPNKALCL